LRYANRNPHSTQTYPTHRRHRARVQWYPLTTTTTPDRSHAEAGWQADTVLPYVHQPRISRSQRPVQSHAGGPLRPAATTQGFMRTPEGPHLHSSPVHTKGGRGHTGTITTGDSTSSSRRLTTRSAHSATSSSPFPSNDSSASTPVSTSADTGLDNLARPAGGTNSDST
jgi:hypothetical protein